MSMTQATLLLVAPILMLVGGLVMFYWAYKNEKKDL